MEEDWFLYSITLFTFGFIFILCYIRSVFTFFERNRIARASTPSFPFGNVSDVIFYNIPMFMQLWKYYNRFKRKKCQLGGFYIFVKPAIVVVDSKLTKAVHEEKEFFESAPETKSVNLENNVRDKILNFVLTNQINLCPEEIENQEINFSALLKVFCEKFFLKNICRDVEDSNKNLFDKISKITENNHSLNSLKKLLAIAYLNFWKNNEQKSIHKTLEEVTTKRKKNDIHENDILQILSDGNSESREIGAIISDIAKKLDQACDRVLFALFELSANEDVQEELREEISRFQKYKSPTNYKGLDELVYLNTVVCEILRKYPLEPFTYKICRKQFVKDNIILQEKILVFVSIFGIHHDPDNYMNPENFDPDRFSEENEKFIKECTYLPFGFVGEGDFDSLFAKLIIKLLLVEVIPKFRFSLGKKSGKLLSFEEASFGIKLKNDMWFRLERL